MSTRTEPRGKVTNSALFRVGILLLIVLALVLILRQMAVPKSFGQFGYYRGDSLNEWAAMGPKYASQDVCQSCHQDKVKSLSSDKHAQLNCQVCHDAAQQHTQKPFDVKPTVPVANAALCASCHANVNGRSSLIPTVNVDQHSAGIACGQCHDPHQPLTIRGK